MNRANREHEPPADAHALMQVRDTIKFLYDKRLTLFNVRREHEWKIYFGAMGLLGGLDAAFLAGRLPLAGVQLWAWVVLCLVVFLACFGYERDLQIRNASDRRAMDTLYNALYDTTPLPPQGPARERSSAFETPELRWAFRWQMLLFGAFTAASAYLPFVK